MKRISLFFALLTPCLAFAQSAGSDGLIRFYQERVTLDETDCANFDRLGSAYLQKARETGDPVYYDLAERAFVHALSLVDATRPEAAGFIAHLAGLDLAEHRFTEAAASARKALALKPDLLSVNAVLGDAQLEAGDYPAAARSYAGLVRPADALPPRPGLDYLAETRLAGLDFIQGKTPEAVSRMQTAIAKATEAGLPKENVAWSQFSLGELYLSQGDFARADAAWKASLDSYPGYHRALAWLGQLRAAQGKYDEAAQLYRAAIAVIPLPAYVAALGDLYQCMGQADEAAKQYAVVDLIARLSDFNQKLFRRELASFYADHRIHLETALAFAQEELAARKDVYTWDVFAWASFQNGRTAEAAAAIDHALSQGTQEPGFFFHAGMIYDRLGDTAKSRAALAHALALNPHFHIVFADTARGMLANQEVADAR